MFVKMGFGYWCAMSLSAFFSYIVTTRGENSYWPVNPTAIGRFVESDIWVENRTLTNISGDRLVIRSKWSEPVGHLDCICSAIWSYAKHPCLWINISGFKFVVETIYYISVWCFVDCYLSFCPFSFGHCTVCPSSIYGFCFASFGIFFDFFFTIDRFVFWKYH